MCLQDVFGTHLVLVLRTEISTEAIYFNDISVENCVITSNPVVGKFEKSIAPPPINPILHYAQR